MSGPLPLDAARVAVRAGLAELLADHMRSVGYCADTAAMAEEHEWGLAASNAETPMPDQTVRAIVVGILHDREQRSRCTRSRR